MPNISLCRDEDALKLSLVEWRAPGLDIKQRSRLPRDVLC